MPTLHDWLNGQTSTGKLLPLETVNRYRTQRNMEPLTRPDKTNPDRPPAGDTSPRKPSLLERVRRFALAQTKHLLAGSPKCSEEQIQARLAICQACDQFDGQHCRVCGCHCNGGQQWLNKLAWADQECPHPDGPKWVAVVDTNSV